MPEDQTNQQQQEGNQDGGETPSTWDAVLEALPEEHRALYETHVHGLKNALDTERNQRKELASQLKAASEQLEEGSAARQQLERVGSCLEEAERKATFYEEATARGIQNLRLAYAAAREAYEDLDGLDWDDYKVQFPELFGPARTPAGNAGDGTGQEGGAAPDMNTFIRASTGRRV